MTLHCRELIELVSDYLDGVLPAHDRAGIEAHLTRCDGCSAYIEQFRATIALIRQTGES